MLLMANCFSAAESPALADISETTATFTMHFRPHGDMLVKNRWLHMMPASMQNPTYDAIWELIKDA